MEFKCRHLALSQIDIANDVHRISTRDVQPRLVESIKAQGVINPPIVRPICQRYEILTGFSRITACRQIGLRKILCHLVKPDISPALCARIAVIDNAMHRDLNLMEQAKAIGLLAQVQTEDVALVQTARECGLSANRDMAHKLLKVSRMSSALRQGLSEGFIALPIALHLDGLEEEIHADAFAQLLIELRVGLNRQREIIDWVVAIARRDDRSISAVLQSEKLMQMRLDPEMDRRQKGQAIRRYIKKMRYPAIAHHQARYAHSVQSLNLEKGTHLSAPPHFEGQTYSLKFDFQSYDDLLKKQEEFAKLIKSQAMKILWKDESV